MRSPDAGANRRGTVFDTPADMLAVIGLLSMLGPVLLLAALRDAEKWSHRLGSWLVDARVLLSQQDRPLVTLDALNAGLDLPRLLVAVGVGIGGVLLVTQAVVRLVQSRRRQQDFT